MAPIGNVQDLANLESPVKGQPHPLAVTDGASPASVIGLWKASDSSCLDESTVCHNQGFASIGDFLHDACPDARLLVGEPRYRPF